MTFLRGFEKIDWWLLIALLPIIGASLITMSSFTGSEPFVLRQIIWILLGLGTIIFLGRMDMRGLANGKTLLWIYGGGILLLITVVLFEEAIKGSTRWISIGGFNLQPSELMKIILILVFAKYLSRRHVEIAHYKHLFITGLYCAIPFILVFIQPDLGTALIFLFIWFGMLVVSGLSRKHIIVLGVVGIIGALVMWFGILAPYQKQRVISFVQPLSDIRGSGYNAYQSTIAVGSGQIFGKGVGYGTQSRLSFLPEHQTDFIFASFAEEWGFLGTLLILGAYIFFLWRIIRLSLMSTSNFEKLVGVGVFIYFFTHIIVNIGMNIGIMPVTGLPLPFMSYGGTHVVTSSLALGLFMGMRYTNRLGSQSQHEQEIYGISYH
jgi:rod shape determining protein RodA